MPKEQIFIAMKKIIYAAVLSTVIYTSGYYLWVASSPIRFKDESFQSGIASESVNASGPTFIDYDDDGDIDATTTVSWCAWWVAW